MNSEAALIRVLLADDDRPSREGTRVYLKKDDAIELRETGDVDGVLPLVREFRPHVVVLDLSFEDRTDINGIDLTERIEKDSPGTRVVMFSNHVLPDYIAAAAKAGARGYIPKGEVDLLLDAIKTVHRGGEAFGKYTGHVLNSLRKKSPSELLTNRECEIAYLIRVEGPLSNKDLAEILFVAPRTISTHLSNIYSNFPELSDVGENEKKLRLAEFARKHRIVPPDPGPVDQGRQRWKDRKSREERKID